MASRRLATRRSCSDPPAAGAAPSGLHIVEVSTAAGAAFEQTLIEAYPIPEMLPWQCDSYLRAPVLDTRWQWFVGYEDGRPVATAGRRTSRPK